MSNRKRTKRSAATRRDREAFFSRLADDLGQTAEEVAEHFATAVRLGLLIEVADGWQAVIPGENEPVT